MVKEAEMGIRVKNVSNLVFAMLTKEEIVDLEIDADSLMKVKVAAKNATNKFASAGKEATADSARTADSSTKAREAYPRMQDNLMASATNVKKKVIWQEIVPKHLMEDSPATDKVVIDAVGVVIAEEVEEAAEEAAEEVVEEAVEEGATEEEVTEKDAMEAVAEKDQLVIAGLFKEESVVMEMNADSDMKKTKVMARRDDGFLAKFDIYNMFPMFYNSFFKNY